MDPWPELTDEELPNDTLPGGPEEDEPDQAAQVGPALDDCGVLTGVSGSSFEFIPKAGTTPDRVKWKPPGGSLSTYDVTIESGGSVFAEDGGSLWWRVDYDADRAGANDGRFKASATHGAVVMQHHDGTNTKKWLGST